MAERFWGNRAFWPAGIGFWAVQVSASTSATVRSHATSRRIIHTKASITVRVSSYAKCTRAVLASCEVQETLTSFARATCIAYAQTSLAHQIIGDSSSGDVDVFVTGRASIELAVESRVTAHPVVTVDAYTPILINNTAVKNERFGPPKKTVFWGGAYRSMAYTTSIVVPDEADGADLRVLPKFDYGSIRTFEYGKGVVGKMWDESPFWGPKSFWKMPPRPQNWLPMPNSIPVLAGDVIFVRLLTTDSGPARLCDMEWAFDVPDAEPLNIQELSVPVGGIRVPVPKDYFRWIKTVNIGLQYLEDDQGQSAMWIDKGVRAEGFVTEGPLLIVVDKEKNSVAGNVDVLLQGAKGKYYG